MFKFTIVLRVLFASILLLCASIPTAAESLDNFRPYKVRVKGYDNRLTAQNIHQLNRLSSSYAKEILLKVGYTVDEETGLLIKNDHYSSDMIYAINLNKGDKAKGYKNITIFSQPEMRVIRESFLADGYDEYYVRPRKGARWTKIYYKEGAPTYSISMLLFPDMNKHAQSYSYEDYTYTLICEKK